MTTFGLVGGWHGSRIVTGGRQADRGGRATEAGRSVGSTGRVCAIDISPDQVEAARARCADLPWVECRVADATELPYDDGSFDAVYCVQVIEYVEDLDRALAEIRRVLRPGGKLVNLATNWSSVVWHSEDPDRMHRVLSAWAAHAPYPDLPAILVDRVRRAGMQPLRQTPVPVLNLSYHPNSFSYFAARLISAYVVGQQAVAAEEAEAWMREFDDLEQRGAYFLCFTPALTEALRPAWRPGLIAGAVVSLLVAAVGGVYAWRNWSDASALGAPGAMRRYGIIVGVEFAVAGAGAAALSLRRDRRYARYLAPWICLVVGVHFWSLAPVLANPLLYPLGTVLTLIAVAAVLASRRTEVAPSAMTGRRPAWRSWSPPPGALSRRSPEP